MTVVEACVVSLAEARAAEDAGASRMEVCADLETGGISPDVPLVGRLMERVHVPIVVMVRPRAGSFRMTGEEVSTMVHEIDRLAPAGVGGFVLGVLDSTGSVDRPALADLVAAAGDAPVTFHRAFDELLRPLDAMETLAEIGVARVLTSGGAETAWEGRHLLRNLVRAAAGRVSIIGGGRVRGDHVVDLVAATGLRDVHARASAVPGIIRALRRQDGAGAG